MNKEMFEAILQKLNVTKEDDRTFIDCQCNTNPKTGEPAWGQANHVYEVSDIRSGEAVMMKDWDWLEFKEQWKEKFGKEIR